ncbi:MAG TPA: hypothetical protein V6D00_06700 [Pantanalinema sp.]
MATTARTATPVTASRGTAPLVLQVTPQEPAEPSAEIELQPLFYRGVTYMMPASVVRAPLPTFTFRHLDKVGAFALEGNRAKVLTSLRRAVSSASDAPSLIKIAAVAHSEGCPDEARSALAKALKVSARHPDMQALVHAGAKALGYEVS